MVGKLVGFLFGFLLTRNIIGALAGLYLGHLFDGAMKRLTNKENVEQWLASDDSKQSVFFYTTFSCMGHMAKITGRVKPEHIEMATRFMDQMRLSANQVNEAKEAFREGKSLGFPLQKKLKLFNQYFGNRQDLKQFFLELQIQMAYSDAILEADEISLLEEIATSLGFSKRVLHQLIAMWEAELRFQSYKQERQEQEQKYQRSNRQSQADTSPRNDQLLDAYALLGVSDRDASRDIKRAYKRLMSQNHPDKLVAKGLPPEMMEMAKRKTQDIQAAYELIRKVRGF